MKHTLIYKVWRLIQHCSTTNMLLVVFRHLQTMQRSGALSHGDYLTLTKSLMKRMNYVRYEL